MELLRDSIHQQNGMRLWGSSILILYDSVPEAWSLYDDEESVSFEKANEDIDFDSLTDVKIIDFVHATAASASTTFEGPDTGALLGVSNLISIFEQIEFLTSHKNIPASCFLRKAT